ncbi:MAG: MotA/TolQ/ExbB proton channel family protein [Pseudomonadota bacterium]
MDPRRSGGGECGSREIAWLSRVISLAPRVGPVDLACPRAAAEIRFVPLESGFRFLGPVAGLTPRFGLFGTVLGIIEACRARQTAGARVKP